MNLAIIADVVESRAQRKKYETALPGIKIQIVRLAVDVAELVRRLEQRESSQSVDWYRNRAAQLTEIMERNGIGDIVVTVNGESPEAVAVTIAEKLKLL